MLSPGNGLFGMLAARLMESANRRSSIDAVQRLNVQPAENVLEIGPGHGYGLAIMSEANSPGRVVAVEISERFRGILQGKGIQNLEVYDADAKDMSRFVSSGSIDKLLAMNVVYFLHPLPAYAAELRRVLKPGTGHGILGCKMMATSHGNKEYFKNKDLSDISATFRAAGLMVREERVDLGNPVESYVALHLHVPLTSSSTVSELSINASR